jgi:MYXO-CTERM domain-containing protein
MRFAIPLSQPCSRSLFAALLLAVLTALPGPARAEQFLLFDATFTYTWNDAITATPSKSHYYVTEKNWLNKSRPANWISPVNYRDGKVHIRAEVIEKPPGTQQAGWALCYVANVGNYGCPYTDYYTKVGVYEKDSDMHTFYNNTTLQWDHGVKEVDLVYTINGSGSGHISNFPALKDATTPTKVRISMVQVSAGSTYDPSILNTGGSADGGAPDAPANETGGAVADAPVTAEDASPGQGTGAATGSGGGVAPPPITGGSGGISGSGGSSGNSGPGQSGVSAGTGCAVAGHGAKATDWSAGASLGVLALLLRRRRPVKRG